MNDLALVLLLPASVSLASETEVGSSNDIHGLWVWSAPQTNEQVSLTVTESNGRWRAEANGQVVDAVVDGQSVSFALADGQGFEATLDSDGASLSGRWLQPPADIDYQFVATPVSLDRVNAGHWQATFAIQPRPYHVFLDVFEGEDEQTAAVIRNPEGNNTMGATRFRLVESTSGGWQLVSGQDERERRHALNPGEGNTLVLTYDRVAAPITLVPASDAKKALYFSRHDSMPTRSSTRPESLDDGWQTAAPEDAGFDPALLQDLTQTIAGLDPRRSRPQLIHSVLVSKDGELVYEEYFYGHDRDKRHDVRSLGKVFGSVMIGALRQQGHDVTPDHRPVANVLQSAAEALGDDRKADITLDHLLTYTSGLDCDVNRDSPGSEGRMWAQQAEPDYWRYTARLPVLHDPGTRYAYCSGSANLVGASLREFGGKSMQVLFDELIAQPLEFGTYHWPLSPNSEGYLGGGMYMRPRDILKIGAMYAAEGVWNGTQLIEEDWVIVSTEPRLEISAETTGMTQEQFENNYFGGSQAYIWQRRPIAVDDRRFMSYMATGNGGQLLIVVPEFNLAAAINGGNYRMGGIWGGWPNQIVGNYFLRALIEPADGTDGK